MTAIVKKVSFGNRTLTMETGMIARQASGSVKIDMDGTTVLVTVVGINDPNIIDKGFFPLRVDYQEKLYAAGMIPGGFFKREGRPSEREILISRLIDRPIRPLFPKNFYNEVQITATVLSVNPEVGPDILALIGASAAIAISGMPFEEPFAATRVGYKDGCYILNPNLQDTEISNLDLVIAGTKNSILMVEAEAKELQESIILEAIMFGHEQYQPIIQAIKELSHDVGKELWNWKSPELDKELISHIDHKFRDCIAQAYLISDKQHRVNTLNQIYLEIKNYFVDKDETTNQQNVLNIVRCLERNIVRKRLIKGEKRIDGRNNNDIRPINIQTGFLERTHGSSLFTRGETQAIGVITLGTSKDAQIMDNIMGREKENFMLHYNFPSYSVGEVGMMGSPKRREIGHGNLSKRALRSIIPTIEKFPYVIRLVSEITESNGSSSMATVCAGSLSLMDAGVPIKAPVAGIAMGLIKEEHKYVILSDILGDEDYLGDMDFKVAGTKNGINALQMDIKINSITKDIISEALEKARIGILDILNTMNNAINIPRTNLSIFAPRMICMEINPEKIKDIIGKGGSVIRGIIEKTGASIDISDNGLIQIASVDKNAGIAAKKQIEELTMDAQLGRIYTGKVVRIVDFGAFINILPGRDGLVHISQIAHHRIENIKDILTEGQEVQVKLIEIDKKGRLKLSIKAQLEEEQIKQ